MTFKPNLYVTRGVAWIFGLIAVGVLPGLTYALKLPNASIFGEELSATVSGILLFSLINLNDLGHEMEDHKSVVFSKEYVCAELTLGVLVAYCIVDTWYLAKYKVSLVGLIGWIAVFIAFGASFICEMFIAGTRKRLSIEREVS